MDKKQEAVTRRLREYLDYKGWSGRKFETICGIGLTSSSRLHPNMKGTTRSKISSHCDLNVPWLLHGEGEMIVRDWDERHPGANITDVQGSFNDSEVVKGFLEQLTQMREDTNQRFEEISKRFDKERDVLLAQLAAKDEIINKLFALLSKQ